MQTDKEKLIELLTQFGVGFTATDGEIKCDQGFEKVTGHYGYFTTFNFDSHGRFIEMGAWE